MKIKIGIMFRLLIGGFLIAHGLLHWRFDMSRSWLLARLGEASSIRSFTALLWGELSARSSSGLLTGGKRRTINTVIKNAAMAANPFEA